LQDLHLTAGTLSWSLHVRNGEFPSFQDISQNRLSS
jgi:hypothetical protein